MKYQKYLINKKFTIMKKVKKITIILAVVLFWINCKGFTQNNIQIDQLEIAKAVDSLALKMFNLYVFPAKGKEVHDLLKKNLKDGIYKEITDPLLLCKKLTEDIQSVTHDRHLQVMFDPQQIAMMKNDGSGQGANFSTLMDEMFKKSNYDFVEVKILKGNIGYLKFNAFHDSKGAFEAATGAMTFLKNTDALIIDLTENNGGSPKMIQYLSSYFFAENDERHLNSFYYRPNDTTTHTYTLPYVPGTRKPDWDIYVLTSRGTFSAAEEFTYNLKNMKRATIVGETTGGGAHPVNTFVLTDNFMASVAIGKAINPITKTNWEGKGVKPDYEVKSNIALNKALLLAHESQMKKEKNPQFLFAHQWELDELKSCENPVKLNEATMQQYAGTYGYRTISYKDGELFYQRDNRPKMKMIPLSKDVFKFEEINYFRLKMIEENGKIVAVEGIYDNGKTERNNRNK